MENKLLKSNLTNNILITSVSKKIPLIAAVKRAKSKIMGYGEVIGGDCNINCISRYFVDSFWEMPLINDINPASLVDFCRENKVKCIIPSRDGELPFFSLHKEKLIQNGINVMVSNKSTVETCLDKLEFFRKLNIMGYPAIITAENVDEIESDYYVVKERFGSGSSNMGIKLNRKSAGKHAENLSAPVFQPYIEGQEVSADLFVDSQGKCKGVVVRSRDLILNGESQITTTQRHIEIEKVAASIAEEIKIYGHAVLQFIIDYRKNIHLIECNSRFGGASTLSIAVGLDSFYWFLLESMGENLDGHLFIRSAVEKKQVRYAEDLII